MNSTKIEYVIKSLLDKVYDKQGTTRNIVSAIYEKGGRAFLVGGAVRDALLNVPIKDLDIEVFDLTLDELEATLRQSGPVRLVGKSFGVLRVNGLDIDWSLPRVDTAGRKPHVTIDPYMEVRDALRRRDLTMNALAVDLKTYVLIDPFSGVEDIKNRVLRSPDIQFFTQDPLRFYRVMQFIGRFEMIPDHALDTVCSSMSIADVSRERIEGEFEKLFLKSKEPSLGIRWLYQTNRLGEIIPVLANTVDIKQRNDYHPEGNVFEHLMQSLDAAAQVSYSSKQMRLIQLYAALFHDLGKVTTSKKVDGIWQCIGHAEAGVAPTRDALKRLTGKKSLQVAVEKLVRYHMRPSMLIASNAGASAYKRLADLLHPNVTIQMLADLFLADRRGRNPVGNRPFTKNIPDVDLFIKRAKKYGVFNEREEPLLKGRDLEKFVEEGPMMRTLLDKAYTIQIDKEIRDKKELLRRVLS